MSAGSQEKPRLTGLAAGAAAGEVLPVPPAVFAVDDRRPRPVRVATPAVPAAAPLVLRRAQGAQPGSAAGPEPKCPAAAAVAPEAVLEPRQAAERAPTARGVPRARIGYAAAVATAAAAVPGAAPAAPNAPPRTSLGAQLVKANPVTGQTGRASCSGEPSRAGVLRDRAGAVAPAAAGRCRPAGGRGSRRHGCRGGWRRGNQLVCSSFLSMGKLPQRQRSDVDVLAGKPSARRQSLSQVTNSHRYGKGVRRREQ